MKDLPLFDGLKPEERMQILDLAVKREFEPGHLLFEEGREKEALYLITRGQVKLWKSLPGGKRVTIWMAGPGDVLGEDSLFKDATHQKSATVNEEAFICTCFKSEFERFVKGNPGLAVRIIKSLGEKLSQSESWRGLLAGHDKKTQLGQLLLRLSGKFGSSADEGDGIELEITHQELAQFLGASRVTVTNSLSELPGVKTENSHLHLEKERLEGFIED